MWTDKGENFKREFSVGGIPQSHLAIIIIYFIYGRNKHCYI